jgi:hypothetical protein
MNTYRSELSIRRQIRFLISVFVTGLVLSGATAIPLETELKWLVRIAGADGNADHSGFVAWLVRVRDGLVVTNANYPFMAYGTDWLAFAHFVIAIAFIGPWRDPVRNVWVIEFGMIACALVVPFALVMGGVRGIPFGWRLIDCSFGILGIIPLWFCHRLIKKLAESKETGCLVRTRKEPSDSQGRKDQDRVF